MLHARRLSLALVAVLAVTLALPACGGGGQGLRVSDNPITGTVKPLSYLTGQAVDEPLGISGGCGGPYVLSVISGRLPDGLGLDDEAVAIAGVVLEEGAFEFQIQIVDTGCNPFSSTVLKFTGANRMVVGQGPLVIYGVDPDPPGLLPPGALNLPPGQDMGYPALPTTVYNDFTSLQIKIAGGVGPYSCEIYDDPGIADDGNLPQGTIIPLNTCTVVGAPVEIKPGGVPFVITFQAMDQAGHKAYLTVYWKIDTPPIQVVTTTLADGRCGLPYSDKVFTIDGVPPFTFDLVGDGPGVGNSFTQGVAGGDPADVVYNSPAEPTIFGNPLSTTPYGTKLTAAAYPAQADNAGGTYDYRNYTPPAPSEGMYLDEPTGTFSGVPRRVGRFREHVHVRSSLVPNEYGQHGWATYEVQMAASDPPVAPTPAFGQTPDYTVEGVFKTPPSYSSVPDAEVGVAYNPDGNAEAGLQLTAQGGVSKDGYTDAPHRSQRSNIEGSLPGQEIPGRYTWDVNWAIAGGNDPIPGVVLQGWTGTIAVPNPALLVAQGYQRIRLFTFDEQLPLDRQNNTFKDVQFSVGPDTVIITESTKSSTVTTSYSGANTLNDTAMKVRVLSPTVTAPVIRDLTNADGTHALPATAGTTSLQTLLTGLDILRVSVNPTSRLDDAHGLNPAGARPFQHGDRSSWYNIYSIGYAANGAEGESGTSVTAVSIPACTDLSVTHDPQTGVYTDGARLYVFDSATTFGIMMIRENSRIYIPAAFNKANTGWQSLGDGWLSAYASTVDTMTRIPQMAMSPNGRWAAFKIKTSLNQYEYANTTKVLLIDLTGAGGFAGENYKIISCGGSSGGGLSGGRYFYANSIALTNRYVYWLCGDESSGYYSSWANHWIYRAEIAVDGAGTRLAEGFNANWTNTSGSPMQTAFQSYEAFSSNSIIGFSGFNTPIYGQYPNSEQYYYSGSNLLENSAAPVPFRVNTGGNTCAILASIQSSGYTGSNVDHMKQFVWVDRDGALHQASTQRRHSPQGGSRGYILQRGTGYGYNWGYRSGPTTGFEISDDGLKVAVVVNRSTLSISPTSTSKWYDAREDVIAFTTTNNWTTATELFPTGDDAGTARVFGSSQLWRFGALAFTRDNNGLVFWGGYSLAGPTTVSSSSSYTSKSYAGSFYSYDFTTGVVKGMVPSADGGNSQGVTTYSTSSQCSPTTSSWSANGGYIKPIGGFYSQDGRFLYIVQMGGLASGKPESTRLLRLNVAYLSGASINGHPAGEGRSVEPWPSRRSFMPVYYYYDNYALEYMYMAPAHQQGVGLQVAAKTNGRVFFASHYLTNGTTTGASTSFGGPLAPTYWGDYGTYGGEVYGFDANVGGAPQQLTNPALGSTTVYRGINFLEVANEGRQVAFGYQTYSINRHHGQEFLGYIGEIDFSSTGSLLPGRFSTVLTTASGRHADAMAHDFTRTKLFYAFGQAAGDENQKLLYEARFDTAAGTFTTRTFGTAKRYNVLNAGR